MPPVITPEVYRSLCRLVDYLYREEESHWQADDQPARHIFLDVRYVAHWLDRPAVKRRERV